VADIELDAGALRRDRDRYARLLDQAEKQVAAWSERAGHLQQAVEGLDRLVALAGDDAARDAGGARAPRPGRKPPAPAEATAPPTEATTSEGPRRAAKAGPAKKAAAQAPPPTATPAAPEPVEPPAAPAADAPKGTDALRLVLESDPGRSWSLAELLEVLGSRGWLPTSRRPEEGVRISLKRLAERGGATRTGDGRWRLTSKEAPPAEAGSDGPTWPPAEDPPAPNAPAAQAAPAEEQPASPEPPEPPPLAYRSASFGLPVGGTVTEV
jgi:hypothetical protein